MTIIVPRDYHAREALEQRRVLCIDEATALREDIRPLHIGILNIMPRIETYEFSLLKALGRSVLQIEPVWIRLKTHAYTSSDQQHLNDLYIPFEQAIDRGSLDGLIVTGAPVDDLPFEEVNYWNELRRIFRWALGNVPRTLGICWGGLALAKYIGLETERYERKLFGVFETRNLERGHAVTGEMDDIYWCPQSRHAGIADGVMERARDERRVTLLAHSRRAGYTIFEAAGGRFLMHLGHPEYNRGRLIEEYRRDRSHGRTDVDPPENIDLERPLNRWRGHRSEFFTQWIKLVHDTVSF